MRLIPPVVSDNAMVKPLGKFGFELGANFSSPSYSDDICYPIYSFLRTFCKG
jgi:hypothetical protein